MHFFIPLVVLANHFGEEFNAVAPLESSSEGMVEAEGVSDFLNPEFRAR